MKQQKNVGIHNTDIDMSGLLQILGENLYSTPSVAIRELIQNAHDACNRRQIEGDTSDNFAPCISVETRQPNKLIIEDNGSGLTHDEIIEFLATIGTGYTRQLRHTDVKKQENTGSVQEQLVGYFGLGFLSAYVVADKVEMYTTSFQNPEETWCFISRGGEQYVLEQSDKPLDIGTRLVLTLKSAHNELASFGVVEQLIQQYCCLLPIPIVEKHTQRAINALQPPWRMTEIHPQQRKRYQFDFAQLFEPNFEPICTFPLSLPDTDGLIWIQDNGFYGSSDNRKVSVFVRNMFISSDIKSLLPSWAGFVGCVINTKRLTPTASREDIQKNREFDSLQEEIAEALVQGLLHLAENEPEHWRRIIARHNSALLGASVSDDRLMNVLQNKLLLPTTLGEMTLDEVLTKSAGKLYIRPENKHGYEDALFRARQIPVVQGWMFAVPRFCDICAPYQQVQLGKTDSLDTIFTPVTDITPEQYSKLQEWFEEENEQLKVVSFEPSFIPLIYTEDQEILMKQRMESDEMDKKIGSAALKLVRLHTNKIADRPVRQVQVNMNNSLIKALLRRELDKSETNNAQQARQGTILLKSYMKALCIDPRGNLDLEALTQNFADTIRQLVFIENDS